MNVSDLPAYEGYFTRYISKVSNLTLSEALQQTQQVLDNMLSNLGEEAMQFRYAPEKWSIAQVLIHTSDTERIMAYRALRAGRGDATPLVGFEQDDLAAHVSDSVFTASQLRSEARVIRESTVQLFDGFSNNDLYLKSNFSVETMPVAHIGFMIAGHQLHHIEVLKERYLPLL